MVVPLRLALLTAVLTGIVASGALAQEMTPPQITSAKVDWSAALASLADNPELRTVALASKARPTRNANRWMSRPLARLNATMGSRFPGMAQSPVPVLLPFDTDGAAAAIAAGTATEANARYYRGFPASEFFFPGPSATMPRSAGATGDVARSFADIKFAEPIDVQISGSALLYELDGPTRRAARRCRRSRRTFPASAA